MVRVLVLLGLLTASASAQLGGPAPPYPEPLRNGFLTASEVVLDGVHAVDFTAAPAAIDGQMSNVKTTLANVASMAENEREHIVAAKLQDVLFALQACRIVATDGQDTAACKAREARAEFYALEAMGVHHEHGAWVTGAPR